MADTTNTAAPADDLPAMPPADALDGDGFPLYRPETLVKAMRTAQRLAAQQPAALELERMRGISESLRAAGIQALHALSVSTVSPRGEALRQAAREALRPAIDAADGAAWLSSQQPAASGALPPLPDPGISYGPTDYHRGYTAEQVQAYARAALAAAPAAPAVAWWSQQTKDGKIVLEKPQVTADPAVLAERSAFDWKPLTFAGAAPAAAQPARQPLSGLGVAAIARKHFGNPIPREAYAFAAEVAEHYGAAAPAGEQRHG